MARHWGELIAPGANPMALRRIPYYSWVKPGVDGMRKVWPVAAMVLCLVGGPKVYAQNLTEWLEPGERRIQLVGATGEQRQVRFGNGWETADYAPFVWGELAGELVFITAHDGTALDFSLTSGEIPRLFRIGVDGGVELGKSGRGPGLLGSAFGQRFTVAGLDGQCFSFQSSDTMSPANAPGLSRRTLFGYACAPTEEPRARIEEFLRSIRFVDRGFVEDGEAAAAATEAEDARQFALGRDDRSPIPRGLAEVPLGYAVPDPEGGG